MAPIGVTFCSDLALSRGSASVAASTFYDDAVSRG